MKLQLCVDKLQRVGWIESLVAPDGWDVMCTLTFRWEASLESTRRCFERWMNRKFAHLSYFYALEHNPSRDGHHVHSLWADCKGVFRKEAWADWFQRYGRAVIEPVRSKRDSSDYASKYLCKRDAWYNVRLQWHRLQKLHELDFKLEGGPQGARSITSPPPAMVDLVVDAQGPFLRPQQLATRSAALQWRKCDDGLWRPIGD